MAGALGEAIGRPFARPELLAEALTHRSALGLSQRRADRRKAPRRSYERLEFLGDRVLGLVIAELLWRRFDSEPEGALTRRHTQLVRRESLARVAGTIGLGQHLIASPAEAAAGAADNPAILADACEALIAAIYLDGGYSAAARFVERFWQPLLDEMAAPPHDPKTALQEWAQAHKLALPVYQLVATSGPDHARQFTIAAHLAGFGPATATATSKRAAEAMAAAMLLDRFGAGER